MSRLRPRLPPALILSLCASFLSACATPTPPPPPVQTVVVHPPLPSTQCPAPEAIADADLANSTAFAAWLNGARGRRWITASRAAGWECFRKLGAIGALQQTWTH